MRRFRLHPPEPGPSSVRFLWEVEPSTPLYKATEFTLRFPRELDLSRVPEGLWWTVALLCLHPHWLLLRPCRVELPVTLPPGVAAFWERLLAAGSATLDAYRGAPLPGEIEIVSGGPRLPPPTPLADSGRCAAAFSGGKDSLLQAALLCELTPRPVLVATTSPMPPLHDHETPRRRHVLAQIAARREVALVEAWSDFRSTWRNDFPPSVGYPVAVNELTDTFLYGAATLVAGAALDAPHLFLASEAEVQENVERDGRVVQHTHFMYSAVTQRAVTALLEPYGFRYGSLTYPLRSGQVQQLLWTRYRDLRDLQSSCWRVGPDEAACNRCSQCLRVALCALALGDTPERMGIDLVRLLGSVHDWAPRWQKGDLPNDAVAGALHRQVVRSIEATPLSRVLWAVLAGGPERLLRPAGWRALLAFARFRRRLWDWPPGEMPGYRRGYLRLLDGLVRDRLAALLAEHFEAEEEAGHAGQLARCDALTSWIVEPLTKATMIPGERHA